MASRPRAVDISADAREFVAIFGKTSQVDKKLRTALRRNIRNAAKVAAKDVQEEVRKPPRRSGRRSSKARRDEYGRGATPLRLAISQGIKVQIASGANSKRVGVYIRATSNSLSGSRKRLVRRWDAGEFRHPVFGDRQTWVTQAGRPYFGSTIRKHNDDVRAAVRAALEEAKASVANSN